MTTLIYVGNSSGCVGRCDAKCYDASSADCDCICGGKNHGAGLKRAQENVEREFLGDTLENLKRDFEARTGNKVSHLEIMQAALPGLLL